MKNLNSFATLYGSYTHNAFCPPLQSLSFHRLAEVDGNLLIPGDAPLVEGIHRDADTMEYLRLMEGLVDSIQPNADFQREHESTGIHFFKGERATTDGRLFEFAPQPLGDYKIFSQPQWGNEWGWLFFYLYRDSSVLYSRWPAWNEAGLQIEEHLDSDAIARIDQLDIVYDYPERIESLFHGIFDLIAPEWRSDQNIRYQAMIYLFKWMLYGLGHPIQTNKPVVNDLLNPSSFDILAQVIPPSIKLFLLWPRAHFSYLLEEISDMSDNPLTTHRMPIKEEFGSIDRLLYDEEISPADLVFIHQASGPSIVATSNHSNMIIPMTDCLLTALSGIIDIYLQAPFTAIPCSWKFIEAAQEDNEPLAISRLENCSSPIDMPRVSVNNFKLFPFVLFSNV